MAGHETTGSNAEGEPGSEPVTPFGTPSPLHREPRVIEGQAIEEQVLEGQSAHTHGDEATETSEPVEPAAPVALERDHLEDIEPVEDGEPPKKNESSPPPIAELAQASQPSHRSLSPIALILAALIGGATGFASAYAARLWLDDSPKTIEALNQHLDALTSKLAADEKKIDTASSGSRDALNALDKRLAAAEKSAKDALGLATAAQTGTPNTGTAETSAAAAPADLTPLQSRVDTLEQHLADIETSLNTPKNAVRAPQEPETKPDPQEVNAPAIAIVAESLVQKVSSGAPFTGEVAALDKLGADKNKLAALQPLAANGVATSRALSDQFTTLQPAMLATEKPAKQSQDSFMGRLIAHAQSLVRVRKVGDLAGEDLPARIARVQDALAHDDASRALQEWASFPEAAKTLSAHWAEAAKLRLDALAEAKAVASEAMANLAKVKS